MKIEDSFKLLLLFAVALAIVLSLVYFIINKTGISGLNFLNKTQNEEIIKLPKTEEEIYQEKLENLKIIRAKLDAQDTRTDEEKRIDHETKLENLKTIRTELDARDTRTDE